MKPVKFFLCTLIILQIIIFTKHTLALNLQFEEYEIKDAIIHAEEHGKGIFNCQDLEKACINFWPRQSGILVRSKFVDLVVIAAMRAKEGQKISEKEIKDIINTPYLKVQVRTKDDVIISLKQGEKIIEPVETDYKDQCCELCRLSGGDKLKHDFVTASFPYDGLDINAKTTITVQGSYHERKYKVDLSGMK